LKNNLNISKILFKYKHKCNKKQKYHELTAVFRGIFVLFDNYCRYLKIKSTILWLIVVAQHF